MTNGGRKKGIYYFAESGTLLYKRHRRIKRRVFFFLSSPSPVQISAATCSTVHGGLLGNGQAHNGDVSHLITQTCQQTAEPRWSDSSLILQLFSCRSQSHGESRIKHRFSVILTTAVKHILMKLEMQKIFSDKSARTAQPEVHPGL